MGSSEQSLLDGQVEEAVVTLLAAVDADPRAFHARELAGVCLRRLGHAEEARALHRDTIARFPGEPHGYRLLADLEMALECPDEALAALEELEARAGTDLDAALVRIQILAVIGRVALAGTAAEALASARPDAPRAWHALGDLRARQGDRAGAVAAYQVAIRLAPSSATLARSLAREQLRSGEHAAARAELERASALDPDDIGTYLDLSVVCLNLGDVDAADRFMASALEANRRNPTHDEARLVARWRSIKDGSAPVLPR